LAVLERLLGDQSPHPMGSEANRAVRQRLLDELRGLGLEVEVQTAEVDRLGTCHNLLARWPTDAIRESRPLVLASHYDSVPAGPGAADAGSCVAALLETVRALKQGPPPTRPFYVLLTDGEELGLVGARAFVRDHPLGRRDAIVLNFDARGTSGASIMYETHAGNLPLIRHVARHFPQPALCGSAFVTIYRMLPNDTDFTVFQRAGWQGMNFAFIGSPHRYHTPQDRIEHLSLRSLQHHGDNALSMARALMDADVPQHFEAAGRIGQGRRGVLRRVGNVRGLVSRTLGAAPGDHCAGRSRHRLPPRALAAWDMACRAVDHHRGELVDGGFGGSCAAGGDRGRDDGLVARAVRAVWRRVRGGLLCARHCGGVRLRRPASARLEDRRVVGGRVAALVAGRRRCRRGACPDSAMSSWFPVWPRPWCRSRRSTERGPLCCWPSCQPCCSCRLSTCCPSHSARTRRNCTRS
jgi:hypothetical protein